MRIVVATTGASGAIYAQRLLDQLDPIEHEVHLVQSGYAKMVAAQELEGGLRVPPRVVEHSLKSMNAPFASGSNVFDAMVIIPCTMGTVARVAMGLSDDLLLRAADVALKEGRKLILVPRETPMSLIHVRNFERLLEAGAVVLPASPSFYHGPKTILELVDSVVSRVLDQIGLNHQLVKRWASGEEGDEQ